MIAQPQRSGHAEGNLFLYLKPALVSKGLPKSAASAEVSC